MPCNTFTRIDYIIGHRIFFPADTSIKILAVPWSHLALLTCLPLVKTQAIWVVAFWLILLHLNIFETDIKHSLSTIYKLHCSPPDDSSLSTHYHKSGFRILSQSPETYINISSGPFALLGLKRRVEELGTLMHAWSCLKLHLFGALATITPNRSQTLPCTIC